MIWKCKHGIVTVEKYCLDCNKKPAILRPGQTIGNKRPDVVKVGAK